MMACELFAGLGGFKSMMDLTRAVQEAEDVANRDKAVLILQKEILEAQVAHALLVVRLSNLEKNWLALRRLLGTAMIGRPNEARP